MKRTYSKAWKNICNKSYKNIIGIERRAITVVENYCQRNGIVLSNYGDKYNPINLLNFEDQIALGNLKNDIVSDIKFDNRRSTVKNLFAMNSTIQEKDEEEDFPSSKFKTLQDKNSSNKLPDYFSPVNKKNINQMHTFKIENIQSFNAGNSFNKFKNTKTVNENKINNRKSIQNITKNETNNLKIISKGKELYKSENKGLKNFKEKNIKDKIALSQENKKILKKDKNR